MEMIAQAALILPSNAAEKRQKKGKAKPKPSGAEEEEEEPKEEIHASLTVHICLLENGVCQVADRDLGANPKTRPRAVPHRVRIS